MDRHKIHRICVELITTVTELAETCEIVDRSAHKQITDKLNEICAEVAAEPRTNGDRIRKMTDEQLAKFLGGIADNCSMQDCKHCRLSGACDDVPISMDKWLKQEAEAENDKAN